MAETTEQKKGEGWCWPGLSKKAHFFREGHSLCRKWMFFGLSESEQTTNLLPGRDDCKDCHKRALKLLNPGPAYPQET